MAGRYPLVCGHRGDGLWWFRVRGYGLAVKDTRRRYPLFSERNRLVRVWRIGPWQIKPLTPVKG